MFRYFTPVLHEMRRSPRMLYEVRDAFFKFDEGDWGLVTDRFESERNRFAREHRCDRAKARYETEAGDILIVERYFHGKGEILAAFAYEELMTREVLDTYLSYRFDPFNPPNTSKLPQDTSFKGLFRAGRCLCVFMHSNWRCRYSEFCEWAKQSFEMVDAWRNKYKLNMMI